MKINKILWAVIGFLALALGVSVLVNLGVIEFGRAESDVHAVTIEQDIGDEQGVSNEQEIRDEQDVVFELRDLVMTMEHGLDLPEGVVLVTLSFNVKNVGSEPYTFTEEHIALFDAKENRYMVSDVFDGRVNPLLYSANINPNTSRKFSVVFEVPAGQLYSVGYTDKITHIGVEKFIDKISGHTYEYANFDEMAKIK